MCTANLLFGIRSNAYIAFFEISGWTQKKYNKNLIWGGVSVHICVLGSMP